MFRSLKQRIDNANQMQRMRNENPEEFRRALEKHTREQLAADNTPRYNPDQLSELPAGFCIC